MTQEFDSQSRNSARLAAVQALYQMELAGQKSKLVVHEFNDHWFKGAGTNSNTDSEYFELIVLGVVAEQSIVDKAISEKLNEKWKLDRLDTTLRAIMRCAAYEILRCFDVPGTVIVDQYVSIAHDFYEGSEPKFVNAALDKLARQYRTAEFGLVHTVDE
ncbi:MAG: transcription antitermination factor NusB [Acidimicrobiales bacterium]|nr:transcription antitermination factor NusB [Hyphomonadaceae bacterium]RZV42735.1 MAG: transcription antitermination factor NusB [Acidimicrobiales bacterium]